jgi:uncharacterized alpha-E superfamily protein
MLSRTAESLFWLGRYSERAGNVARGLSATHRMASLAAASGGAADEWRALIVATGSAPGFDAKHAVSTPEAAICWLTFDADNPSGIAGCIEAARRNARSVRTALTADMWAAINDTWSELRRMPADAARGDRMPGFLEWVGARTLLFNGAAADTMLRDDAWLFVRLGTMLERADNTARLLDARHAAFAPGGGDASQWQAALRAVSALRAYQHVFRTRLNPRLTAELLILRPELPRSMRACTAQVDRILEQIGAATGRRGEAQRLAGEQHAALRFGRIEDILAGGLHGFLTRAIDRNLDIGREIAATYLDSA